MTDVYRTSAMGCPACASPMREFKQRMICDACEGMLIGFEDFRTACADLIGTETSVEVYDLEPSAREPKPQCPKCQGELADCRLRVHGKKMRGRYATCARDGIWFGRDQLPAVFARIGSTLIAYVGGENVSASDGLAIARWRNRPRKRAHTLTPVNAYADKTLPCPACTGRELVFMADRWGCDHCRGVFVQVAALEALVGEMIGGLWAMPAATGEVGGRACPVCVAPMTIETLDRVAIDRCAAHGVWFDPHELETVLVREGEQPTGVVAWLRRLF